MLFSFFKKLFRKCILHFSRSKKSNIEHFAHPTSKQGRVQTVRPYTLYSTCTVNSKLTEQTVMKKQNRIWQKTRWPSFDSRLQVPASMAVGKLGGKVSKISAFTQKRSQLSHRKMSFGFDSWYVQSTRMERRFQCRVQTTCLSDYRITNDSIVSIQSWCFNPISTGGLHFCHPLKEIPSHFHIDRDFDINFSWFFKLKPLASTREEKKSLHFKNFKKMTLEELDPQCAKTGFK